MALTITEVARTVFGNKRVLLADITFDASYPSGGEPLTAATLGFTSIDRVLPSVAVSATPEAIIVDYDESAELLIAYRVDQIDDVLEEIPDTTDLSAFTVTLQIIGV